MDRESIREQLVGYGLGDKADAILGLGVDCFGFETERKSDEEIAIGDSKLGGCPDLPEGIEWPRNERGPLSFLGQIRFSDLAACHGLKVAEGTEEVFVYFFYDVVEQPWGFDPKHRDMWRVLSTGQPREKLVRRAVPEGIAEWKMGPCAVTFFMKYSIPGTESIDAMLELSKDESDKYMDFLMEVYDGHEEGRAHQMFGHPMALQGEMRLSCQLAFHGIYCGDSSFREHSDYPKVMKEDNTWVLLMQLDSDEKAGMMWGDMGRLYFWIRQEDLKQGAFENCWLVLQCG